MIAIVVAGVAAINGIDRTANNKYKWMWSEENKNYFPVVVVRRPTTAVEMAAIL